MSAFNVQAQSNKELAVQKGKDGVKLIDNEKYDEGIKLLEEAQKLDPSDITYPYEITYAYYYQKKYDKAIELLTKLKDDKDAFDNIYQLLGNSYDIIEKQDKAIEIYEEGLKKFPSSGKLFLERGVLPLIKKDYDQAVSYFQKGIKADPTFPSNYFWCTKIFCSSTEKMWGMIYDELFMNLERNSKRTAEISKLLYDTYKSQIIFKSATETSVSFSKQSVISDPSKLPFSMIYEPSLLFAIIDESNIDINSLNNIRKKFLDFYFQKGFNKTYPNVLFDYQDKLKKASQFDAYNHWLLMKGDEAAFNTWKDANKQAWDSFITWFSANKLKLDNDNKFYHTQYN